MASGRGRHVREGRRGRRRQRADLRRRRGLVDGAPHAPGSVRELWTFFPDPSARGNHHKRRLVGAPVRGALPRAGWSPRVGVWRLATDWADYAQQMVAVLDAEESLTGGVVDRWDERPITRFERKGVAAGRSITDLCYRRRRLSQGGRHQLFTQRAELSAHLAADRPGPGRGGRRPRT